MLDVARHADWQSNEASSPVRDCYRCALATCTFRNSVSCSSLEAGKRMQHIIDAKRGDLIIGGAVACHRLWVVIKGLVALATVLPDGRRQITGLCTPGDVICPVGALSGTESWVEALGPSVVCQIALSDVLKADGRTPDLMASLFRHSHDQLERSSRNQVMLGRYGGMERIYAFLSEITRRIGVECPGGYRIHLPMCREDIADYLGLNPGTVIRLFSRLRKTSFVTFISPTDFIVHDLEGIESQLPNATSLPASKAV